MKCQILFCGKNKTNIFNWLSAELAQRVIKVNVNPVCILLFTLEIVTYNNIVLEN